MDDFFQTSAVVVLISVRDEEVNIFCQFFNVGIFDFLAMIITECLGSLKSLALAQPQISCLLNIRYSFLKQILR